MDTAALLDFDDFDDEDDDLMMQAACSAEEAMKLDKPTTWSLSSPTSAAVSGGKVGESDRREQRDDAFSAPCPPPSRRHLDVLKSTFGHNEFRPYQWHIIRNILELRRDQCIVMATGYGKSLCYQYPAVYANGLTVVVSPLISLMEDQVMGLQQVIGLDFDSFGLFRSSLILVQTCSIN